MKWIDMKEEEIYNSLEDAQQVFYDETGIEEITEWLTQQDKDYISKIVYDIFMLLCKYNNNNNIADNLIEIFSQIEDTIFFERFKELDEESGVINGQ